MAPTPYTEPEPDLMVEINTTPLVDVMLVLIIMLIVTVPLQRHAVTWTLPGNQRPSLQDTTPIRIALDTAGGMRWNDAPLANLTALEHKLRALAHHTQPPPIHLQPDTQTEYQHVARVMALAQRLGLTQLGIVQPAQTAPIHSTHTH